MSDAIRYWALVEAVGLLALPVAGAFFARLPGSGFGLARPLGLLLVAYPVWLLASVHIVPYTTASAWLGLALLAAVAALTYIWGRRAGASPLAALARAPERNLWLAGEALFALAFGGWALLRAFAPDVWGTEKPMDMAFVNAINRSSWMPPHDPWLSGATINYYYFGHFIVAWTIRVTGVAPWVGFNLGVALFYALSATAVFGVTSALYLAARRHADAPAITPIIPGLAAAALAMLLGNLVGALELAQKPGPLLAFDWWSPSRVIANTINEFPYFSFLLADLHAHMLAAPFGLTALAFAMQLAVGGPRVGDGGNAPQNGSGSSERPTINRRATPAKPAEAGWGRFRRTPAPSSLAGPSRLRAGFVDVARQFIVGSAGNEKDTSNTVNQSGAGIAAETLLAGLLVGSLYALNGWDYPTELGIGFLGLLLWASRRTDASIRVGPLAAWAVAWLAVSFLLFLPFYLHFKAPAGGIGVVRQHDGLVQYLHDYLLIYGLFIWIIASAFVGRLRRMRIPGRYIVWIAVAAGATLALLASTHLDGVALLLIACAFALSAAVDSDLAQPLRLWWLLVGVAIGLATIGEVVYVRDAFVQTADYRMNTVFKFGYQAWFILAVAAGCAVCWNKRWMARASRPVWLVGLLLLTACAGVYTVAGADSREGGFRNTPTLDGLRWLTAQAPGDAAAIRWLNLNVQGTPTIVEAVGSDYDAEGHARVSTFTGLPAVLGWPGHEAQWDHDQGTRQQDVQTLYTTTDLTLARSLVQRYAIRYVFVGSLERADFPPAGLAKFGHLAKPVFSADGTIVYEVPG